MAEISVTYFIIVSFKICYFFICIYTLYVTQYFLHSVTIMLYFAHFCMYLLSHELCTCEMFLINRAPR